MIVYGIAKDARGLTTILSPIPLKGARERVDQIIRAANESWRH